MPAESCPTVLKFVSALPPRRFLWRRFFFDLIFWLHFTFHTVFVSHGLTDSKWRFAGCLILTVNANTSFRLLTFFFVFADVIDVAWVELHKVAGFDTVK